MKLFQAYQHLLIFFLFTTKSIAIPKYAKTGCNDTCGHVTIPYPFGIGTDCSVNKWYTVDCNSSTPYVPALNHSELLGVNLYNQIVTVNMPKISGCPSPARNSSQSLSIDLGNSPFLFSKSYNKFVFEGCGIAVVMDNVSVVTGCSTACPNVTLSHRNNCFGIGCCQATIPHYLKSYNVNITSLEEEAGGCGYALLVDEALYDERRFSDRNTSFIPVSLQWTLAQSDELTCCDKAAPIRRKVDISNGNLVDTWECKDMSGYKGNPYLIDGCKYDDGKPTEECERCKDKGGFCAEEIIYNADGDFFSQNFTCRYRYGPVPFSPGIFAGQAGMVLLFVFPASYTLYKVNKIIKAYMRRKRFFKRNGGLLLKQQQKANSSLVDKTIHFTSRDLKKATNSFSENRIVGRGGQGTVYKGMLVDGRIVAVKKSIIVDESQLEQFINEVVVLSQINHRNVVKLLGCCLETEVPLLVSEFIANGTLYDRLHSKTDDFPISLEMRLRIATEVACALSYLHSATSIPIYHRDIKTTNILLDEKYNAKVSDFGTSRFVSVDQTHLTTLVKGTFGYLDPEYFQSSQFTEKSDVYSFGVVLVELLTGEKPISLVTFGEKRSLAAHFMLAMEEGSVMSIFDEMVIEGGTREELLTVANLARRCLNMNGKYRPTMKEVAVELEAIRMSHIHSTVQTNTGPLVYGEERTTLTYGKSLSAFLSFNDIVSQ